jgi:hypothetical protein
VNSLRIARPLRSTAITAASSLLRDSPPPCPGPVLCLSRFLPLEELPPPRALRHGDSRTTGSPVPCKSLNRARALFTPDAAGAVSRSPPGLSQDRIHPPGFDITLSISTLPQGFGFTRLHDPYLTQSLPRLFRDAHHPGSLPAQLAVVCCLLLQGDSGGPASISYTAPTAKRPHLRDPLTTVQDTRTLLLFSGTRSPSRVRGRGVPAPGPARRRAYRMAGAVLLVSSGTP